MEIYDVFISYRRSDGAEIAEALNNYLTAKGLRVFWDKVKMEYGAPFPIQLKNAVLSAPTYVLICTQDVFNFREKEDWVQEEMETALTAAKGNEHNRPICVLDPLADYFPTREDLPDSVADITYEHRIPLGEDQEKAFREVFRLATRVTRNNLWNGAHKWFLGSKSATGRFSRLSICQSILPNVDREHQHTDIPIYTSILSQTGNSPSTSNLPLVDTIARTQGHLFLIGQGGIGKTTALMHIMNRAYIDQVYTPGTKIPIFVELSFAPDTYGALYSTEVSSFIRRSIYRQIRADLRTKQIPHSAVQALDDVFSLSSDVAVDPLSELFAEKNSDPEFLLLLDGLNEVSTVYLENGKRVIDMIVDEIIFLMSECPNVRVILTSRSEEMEIGKNTVTRLRLTGIEPDSAKHYLSTHGFSPEQITSAFSDPDLANTLSIPLFLTMYAASSRENTATTQGEILRLFFHERSKNLELYTNQDRLFSLEHNVKNAASLTQRYRIEARMFHFMLDFLLPELAWNMVQRGLFYISQTQVEQWIIPLLTGKNDADICGRFGKALFQKYRKPGNSRMHVRQTAQDIRQTLGEGDPEDHELITETFLNCCMTTLGILQDTGGRFGFVHQHIRDYFASVKLIHAMELALHAYDEEARDVALQILAPLLQDAPIERTVRKFMGEYLGEHKNKPILEHNTYRSRVPLENCDRTLISRVLNLYRDRFAGEDGYALFSLLQTLIDIRGSLAGCDLSRLDLTGCQLNAAGLGISGLGADLHGAKLNADSLFFVGHTDQITDLDHNSDGTLLLSASKDGTVVVRNAKTGVILNSFTANKGLTLARFIPDQDSILTVSRFDRSYTDNLKYNFVAQLSDPLTGTPIKVYHAYTYTKHMVLSADKSRLLCYDDSSILVLSIPELTELLNGNMTKYLMDSGEVFDSPLNIKSRIVGFRSGNDTVLYSYCTSSYSYRHSKAITKLFSLKDLQFSPAPALLSDIGISAIASRQNSTCVAFFADRKPMLRVVDIQTGSLLREVVVSPDQNSIGSFLEIRYSDTGKWMALIDFNAIYVFETEHYRPIKVFPRPLHHPDWTKVSFDDLHQKLVLGNKGGDIYVYDTREFILHQEWKGGAFKVNSAVFAPDSPWLCTCSSNGLLQVWDIQNRVLCCSRLFPENLSHSLRCSPDGRLLYLYHPWKDQFSILTIPDLHPVIHGSGHAQFSPNGNYLAISSRKGTEIYSLKDHAPYQFLPAVKAVAFSGDRVILADIQSTHQYSRSFSTQRYTVFDLIHKQEVAQIHLEEPSSHLDICGNYIAITLGKHGIQIYDTEQFRLVREFKSWYSEKSAVGQPDHLDRSMLLELHFTPDGKYLMEITDVGYRDYTNVIIRKAPDFAFFHKLDRISTGAIFSPKGTFLLAFSPETHFSVHDYRTGTCTQNWIQSLGIDVNSSETLIANLEATTRLSILQLDPSGKTKEAWEILLQPGLDVLGLDLRRLHPKSVFTTEQQKMLRLYGAMIE